MSISITSTAEWFRCIRGTSAEHHAALARLVRMLCGDDRRARPPISLPGRPAMPTAPPPAEPQPVKLRSWRQALPTGKTVNAPNKDADGDGPYRRAQLLRMDMRFAQRLERAIANGEERPHA